jgi:hypothetical protein
MPYLERYHCDTEPTGEEYLLSDGNAGKGGGTPALVKVANKLRADRVPEDDIFTHPEFQQAFAACKKAGKGPISKTEIATLAAGHAQAQPEVSGMLAKLAKNELTVDDATAALNASAERLSKAEKQAQDAANEAKAKADAAEQALAEASRQRMAVVSVSDELKLAVDAANKFAKFALLVCNTLPDKTLAKLLTDEFATLRTDIADWHATVMRDANPEVYPATPADPAVPADPATPADPGS